MRKLRTRIAGLILLAAISLVVVHFLPPRTQPPAPVGSVSVVPQKFQPAHAGTTPTTAPVLERTASPAPVAVKNPPVTTAATQLWAAPRETQGEKLDRKSARYLKAKATGGKLPGRSAIFDPSSLASLPELQRGDNVVIPLLGGEQVTGRVNLVQQEASGQVLVGGALTGPRGGSFSLGNNGGKFGGTILLPQEEIAYVIAVPGGGQVLMQEKHLSQVICFPMLSSPNAPGVAPKALVAQSVPPVLSSRPGATAVLYMDFDGATVTDPAWRSGQTIAAQPSLLSSSEIAEVWSRVREDFLPFNIDVTTDANRYNGAPVGRRMRCIVTPTKEWYVPPNPDPDVAVLGVARTDSFAQAGQGEFSSTIPCWAFGSSVNAVAETISHEVGHTLGLQHDGGMVASEKVLGNPGPSLV